MKQSERLVWLVAMFATFISLAACGEKLTARPEPAGVGAAKGDQPLIGAGARCQNFDCIKAKQIQLTSGDGKQVITLAAMSDSVGIWVGKKGGGASVLMVSGGDGTYLGLHTEKSVRGKVTGCPFAVVADEAEGATIQLIGKKGGLLHLTLDQLAGVKGK